MGASRLHSKGALAVRLLLAAWALAVLGCGGKTKQAGGLELIIATDMPTPASFDTLHVVIEQESASGAWKEPALLDSAYVIPSQIQLPTTISVTAGSSAYQEVLVTVTGLKGGPSGQYVVQRVVQTQVPTDRVAELVIELAAVCAGIQCPTTGDSCLPVAMGDAGAGACGTSVVTDSMLPVYASSDLAEAGVASTPEAVPSGAAGDGGGDATTTTVTPMPDATMEAASVVPEGASPDGPSESTEAGPGGPACTNACTAGESKCVSGGVQTCQAQAGGCMQWVATATCGAHQTCVATTTSASCVCSAGACTLTGSVCQDAQTLGTCAKDADGCYYVASTSPCTSPKSCSGMAPGATCSLTCSDSCSQGQTTCILGGLATCTLAANGCWSYPTPVGCGAHQSCTGAAGTAGCTCNTDPQCSAVGNVCASTTTLATCSQDAQNCVYDSATAACVNGACSGGACCTNACTNGATTCASSTMLQTCSIGSNGCTALTPSACVNGACSGGACCTNACTVGAVGCGGGGTQSCQLQANGCTAWTNVAACSTGLVCERYLGPVCLDPKWAEWPMPNSQVDVTNGAPNLESYTNNGDGTVSDNVTGLMWQQVANGGTFTQPNAIAYCVGLSLAGHADWRLPTEVELFSLVDTGQTGPALNTTYFPNAVSSAYWSSTVLAGTPTSGWEVDFTHASTTDFTGTDALFARCVR